MDRHEHVPQAGPISGVGWGQGGLRRVAKEKRYVLRCFLNSVREDGCEVVGYSIGSCTEGPITISSLSGSGNGE